MINNKNTSDYIIGQVAAMSMYISVLFIILQVFVWIPVAIVSILLVEGGIIPQFLAGFATIVTLIVFEMILIFGIIFYVRKKYLPLEMVELNKEEEYNPFIFKEIYLEKLLNITAIAGILWILLLGMQVSSIKYFLFVVQGFGVLFFTIFIVVRLLLTRFFSLRTLFSIILSIGSIIAAAK